MSHRSFNCDWINDVNSEKPERSWKSVWRNAFEEKMFWYRKGIFFVQFSPFPHHEFCLDVFINEPHGCKLSDQSKCWVGVHCPCKLIDNFRRVSSNASLVWNGPFLPNKRRPSPLFDDWISPRIVQIDSIPSPNLAKIMFSLKNCFHLKTLFTRKHRGAGWILLAVLKVITVK